MRLNILIVLIVFVAFCLPWASAQQNQTTNNESGMFYDATAQTKILNLDDKFETFIAKNRLISDMLTNLQKANLFFIILFARGMTVTVKFFLVVVLWVLLTYILWDIYVGLTPLNKLTSLVVALASSIIFSQLGLLELSSSFILWAVLKENAIIGIITGAFILILAVWLIIYFEQFLRIRKQRDKKLREQKHKINQDILEETVDSLTSEALRD